MSHIGRLTAVATLLVAALSVGAAAADTAGVRTAEAVNATDDDGDGYVSAFDVRVVADTECVGCNDESLDDPYIEPYFVIRVDRGDGEGFVAAEGTGVVRNESRFETTLRFGHWLRANVEGDERRTLLVRLELWDADPLFDDEVDEVTFAVDVESAAADENSPPTAAFTVEPSRTSVGSEVTFDASSASDPDAPLAGYRWDVDGDGDTDATGETATWTFERAGDHDVRLVVVDAAGATDAAEHTVRVVVDTDGDGLVDSRDPFPASRALPALPLGAVAALSVAALYRRRRPTDGPSLGVVGLLPLGRRGGAPPDPAGGPEADGDPDPLDADDVDELLERAAARADAGREARERGDHDAAVEALGRAVTCYERVAAADAGGATADAAVADRLERTRAALVDARERRDAFAELSERLRRGEALLADADGAYDEGRLVVARLRYRQARDSFRAARRVADEHGLERLGVEIGGRRFEDVDDVDERAAAAADGLDAAG